MGQRFQVDQQMESLPTLEESKIKPILKVAPQMTTLDAEGSTPIVWEWCITAVQAGQRPQDHDIYNLPCSNTAWQVFD